MEFSLTLSSQSLHFLPALLLLAGLSRGLDCSSSIFTTVANGCFCLWSLCESCDWQQWVLVCGQSAVHTIVKATGELNNLRQVFCCGSGMVEAQNYQSLCLEVKVLWRIRSLKSMGGKGGGKKFHHIFSRHFDSAKWSSSLFSLRVFGICAAEPSSSPRHSFSAELPNMRLRERNIFHSLWLSWRRCGRRRCMKYRYL